MAASRASAVREPPGVLPLGDGQVVALCNSYAVDGRVSWHPPSARGTSTFNCYALVEDADTLLIDTGLSVHEQQMLGQVRTVLGSRSLSVLSLRQGEFDSLCNLVPILEQFADQVDTLYGQFDDVVGWAAFRPEQDEYARFIRPRLRTRTLHGGDSFSFGSGARRLFVDKPMLRLLTSIWIYDEATETLFSSDAFTHALAPSAEGPWLVTPDSDTTTYEEVRDHMLGTRYWWISRADVTRLRRDLAAIFERRTVTTIAPAWGCPLVGAPVVARHYELVDEVLRREGRG